MHQPIDIAEIGMLVSYRSTDASELLKFTSDQIKNNGSKTSKLL